MRKESLSSKIVAITFFILMLSASLFAQTPFVSWDFNAQTTDPVTGSGTITTVGGVTPAEPAFASGFEGTGTYAWNTTNYPAQGSANETGGIQINVSTVGKTNILVNWVQRNSNTAANRVRVQYSLNGTSWVNFDATETNSTNMNTSTSTASGFDNGLYITEAGTVWHSRSADFSAIAGANNNANFAVRIVSAYPSGQTQYASSNPTGTYGATGTYRFDNVIFSFTDQNTVIAPIINPNGGNYSAPVEVSMSCATPDAQIRYTTDGSEPTASSTLFTAPITISQTTTVKAKGFKTGMQDSETTSATFSFAVSVSNLGQLRSATADGTTVYNVTGEVFLTFKQSFRHQKFVQDAHAAILIDDYNGIITSNYNVNDGITGLTGKISVYNGMLQFVPIADPGQPSSTNNTIPVRNITIEQLNNSFDSFEAQLVSIQNVHFINPPADTFGVGTVYTFGNNSATGNFRTSFYDADYIGQNIPVGDFHMLGILSERTDGQFITSRDFTDFRPVGNNDQVVVRKSVLKGNYPNPFNPSTTIAFSIANPGHVELSVFNVKGQKVKTLVSESMTTGDHTINWNGKDDQNRNVGSGVYYYKLTSQDNTQVRKAILMK